MSSSVRNCYLQCHCWGLLLSLSPASSTCTVVSGGHPPTHTAPPSSLLHPHSHPPQHRPAGCPCKLGALRQGGVRFGSPRKGFTQLCLPRSLLLVTQLPSGQGQCYRPLVTLSRRRSGFLQRSSSLRGIKESGVQKQPALAPGKRGGTGARGQIETTEEGPWCTVCP